MTNTLICREDVLSELACCCSEDSHEMFRAGIETAIEILEHAPTEFDKEKVIEELDKLTGEECTLHECGIRSERCKACIAKKAIEIVEKGGIE